MQASGAGRREKNELGDGGVGVDCEMGTKHRTHKREERKKPLQHLTAQRGAALFFTLRLSILTVEGEDIHGVVATARGQQVAGASEPARVGRPVHGVVLVSPAAEAPETGLCVRVRLSAGLDGWGGRYVALGQAATITITVTAVTATTTTATFPRTSSSRTVRTACAKSGGWGRASESLRLAVRSPERVGKPIDRAAGSGYIAHTAPNTPTDAKKKKNKNKNKNNSKDKKTAPTTHSLPNWRP